MRANVAVVEQSMINKLPKETLAILELFDQINEHTNNLRNKIVEELKTNTISVRLKLDNI